MQQYALPPNQAFVDDLWILMTQMTDKAHVVNTRNTILHVPL